ncbi:MAG: FGGY-family carbohydrate kinase, partial [Eggerthellaceae bacterium]|nr:FGGY-family carbohydrate kinase [Eggerthellaceae bacterium]
ESETLARSVPDTAGVYVIPAFTGLGAPHWDANARGAVFGLTRGTKRAHIVRAALEAIAYQVNDLVAVMAADAQRPISVLNADGGASRNNFLMQFQSDILQLPLARPKNIESTALGAAFLAGLSTGFWEGLDELRGLHEPDQVFLPGMPATTRSLLLEAWADALFRTRTTR